MKVGPFLLTPCALVIDGQTTVDQWAAPIETLEMIQRSIQWWIGDMLTKGEQQFGDLIFQAISDTMSPDLVDRCAAVAREFPVGERKESLSFTHHMIVMGLPKALQRALLNKAEDNRWNTTAFREHVARIKRNV